MLISYSWLKEYTGDTTNTAQEAADLLGVHSFEIEGIEEKGNDTVIEIDILPNRASDALCHRGIARELATLTGKELKNDLLTIEPEIKAFDQIEINIEDSTACPRFTASLITGITVKESPDWLKEKLEAIGQRPINNIVDATNYVMFAMGQPTHAYDADLFPQVDGKWQMGVRYAKEGETVSLIAEGGKDEERIVELQETDQLIVDGSSNTPIGLAGVKGGRFAGVHEASTQIIIEAAHFHPTSTRKTARRLGIVIDASKRFENEPSRELPPFAQSQIIKLITDIAGGEYVGTVDTYLEKQMSVEVKVSVERTNAHLGLSLTAQEMVDILKRVGCTVSTADDTITATGPFERTDLNIEEDYIEEIGRIFGYRHIASVAPEGVALKSINKRHYYSEKVRETLVNLGFSEVITSSFRKKDEIQLQNALASDKSYLRSSLLKNISEVLDKNVAHTDLLGNNDTRVFEIGTVFNKEKSGVAEHISLCFGVRIKPSGYTGKEDKVLKDAIAKLEEVLDTQLEVTIEKGIVEINFTDVFAKASVPTAYDAVEVAQEIVYKPFSLYPSMSRDIALWVAEGTSVPDVEQVLNEHAGDLRVRTTLFDEFSKDGRTSYAFRLVFQAADRTLTDEEVNTIMEQIYTVVQEKKWEVR